MCVCDFVSMIVIMCVSFVICDFRVVVRVFVRDCCVWVCASGFVYACVSYIYIINVYSSVLF